jgi:hypothetical protein
MHSVHADDFCVRHYRHLILRGWAQASQAWHYSRTGRTQDNEHTLAAPHSINGRSDCGALVTGHNEIDGWTLHHISPEKFNRGGRAAVSSTIVIGRRGRLNVAADVLE